MTLAKLRASLAKIKGKLIPNQSQLERATNRYKANRKRAFQAHNKQIKFQKQADALNRDGHKVAAQLKTKAAGRQRSIAEKNHARAEHFLETIKAVQGKVNFLEGREEFLQSQIKKLDQVTIKGNKATGGTDQQRLKAVALASAAACSSGQRNNFYSQSGTFDADHCITGPAYGHRDDCSSWFASVYKSAGLPDPSGEDFRAGYTGTLVANGKQVSSPQPGDAVIYGSGAGHHVEMYIGPGDKTIGHGSAPVDAGVINLFGDGDYRFFRYI